MQSMVDLRKKVIDGKILITELSKYESDFRSTLTKILSKGVYNKNEVEAFLNLCLDIYVFDEDGNVIISDHEYDEAMNIWRAAGNDTIVYPDTINVVGGQWKFIKHKIPGMVGTLDKKLYTYNELKQYMTSLSGVTRFRISPKFDGISAAIEMGNGDFVSGATRYDGVYGMDITAVIKSANTQLLRKFNHMNDGFYKVELVVSTDDFNNLVHEKAYRNRRSASSGIVSHPKNLNLANYITAVPLLYYDGKNKCIYNPPGSREIRAYHPRDLMSEIEKMLAEIRNPTFPYRVDGVVIYPIGENGNVYFNPTNMMDGSSAFKINTNEAKTKIKRVYMSVGRLGKAVPMAEVIPCELNETVASDCSLGSYARFLKLGIHEDETVIIFSAGDVIPQMRLPDEREYRDNAPLLKLKKRCPFCGEKLSKQSVSENRSSAEYCCDNSECSRVITGRITNFIVKLGVDGYSDQTILDLYEKGLIKSIPDIFTLDEDELAALPGYGVTSAKDIISEMNKLRERPITTSAFFGALGIPNISEKKCKKIFEFVSLDVVMKHSKKSTKFVDNNRLVFDASAAEGIGIHTATVFSEFINEHREEILALLDIMNIRADVKYKGTVVFTRFDSQDYRAKFKAIGFDVGETVTKSTNVLISADSDRTSTNCKKAFKYDIPIVDYIDIDRCIEYLKEHPYFDREDF